MVSQLTRYLPTLTIVTLSEGRLRNEYYRCAYCNSTDTALAGGGHVVAAVGEMAPKQNSKEYSRSILPLRLYSSLAFCNAVVGHIGGRPLGSHTYGNGDYPRV